MGPDREFFDSIQYLRLGLAVLWALLFLVGLVVALVYRRVSGWTALLAVAFGLKLVNLLLTQLGPLLFSRFAPDFSFRYLQLFFFGTSVLSFVADALLIFGLAAVLAHALRRLRQYDGPRRPLMDVQPGEGAGSAEERAGRPRRLGDPGIQP
jgi:hypothetical protein